jgi:hypothetical protein
MRRRFSEQDGSTKLVRETREFTHRGGGPATVWLMVCLGAAIGVLILLASLSLRGAVLDAALLLPIVALALTVVVFLVRRIHARIAVAEYQSMVLASVVKGDTIFCHVYNPDGTLFFSDSRYFEIFPQGDPSRVAGVLFDAGLQPEDAEWLQEGIRERTMASVLIEVIGDRQEPRHASLGVMPLPRPEGYFALRAVDA